MAATEVSPPWQGPRPGSRGLWQGRKPKKKEATMAKKFSSHKVFKRNTRARMAYLGVTALEVSREAGERDGWLTAALGKRYGIKVGSHIIDKTAEVLGVTPWGLTNPDAPDTYNEAPEWTLKAATP